MKTVYYLPFAMSPSNLLKPSILTDIVDTVEKFKETFLSEYPGIIVTPTFNGKEGFEFIPEIK